MVCTVSERGGSKVAVLQSVEAPIATAQDALDLVASIYYQHACLKVVLLRDQLAPEFFQLRTGLAGEILQKFTNYHMAVAIVGDFSRERSKPLRDFIYECNRGKQVFFVPSAEEALERLHALAD